MRIKGGGRKGGEEGVGKKKVLGRKCEDEESGMKETWRGRKQEEDRLRKKV